MAKEYIERKAVIKKCNKLLDNADSCPEQHILDGVKLVRDLILIDQETRVPTADVAPVIHGKWIDALYVEKYGDAYCSECNHFDWSNLNYCSNCGARMDGGKG